MEEPTDMSHFMNSKKPVHEIRLGAVRAAIWEGLPHEESKYRISISRAVRPGERPRRSDEFEADDLPLVAEVVDLAHLWICEQAELIA
jgi:hypothetical protein